MSKAREIVGLDCQASAAEGIRLLLHTRVEEMCDLRDLALDWSDIEGVHDMRVASRRLRSALRDFKPFLSRRKHNRADDSIKRLADSLGAVRDKDVAIAALEKLAANATPDIAAGIEQFVAQRRLMRDDDRSALMAAIAEHQLDNLRREFEDAVEAALGSSGQGRSKTDAGRLKVSFRVAGQKIVKARMEELQGLSASLYRPLSTKPLHRMRIAAKRLRYAIELFAQCWDNQLDEFAKEVAELQTSLGELHDCDVWIAEFGGLLEKRKTRNTDSRLDETVDADEQRCHASVWLLGHFAKRRTSHYRDALTQWHEWETTDFFARLETFTQNLTANDEPPHAGLRIVRSTPPSIDSRRAS